MTSSRRHKAAPVLSARMIVCAIVRLFPSSDGTWAVGNPSAKGETPLVITVIVFAPKRRAR